jgi:hypothetical protein
MNAVKAAYSGTLNRLSENTCRSDAWKLCSIKPRRNAGNKRETSLPKYALLFL